MNLKKSQKKIEKFWRFKNNVYLCNPVKEITSETETDNNADVAQLARARDL